MKISIGSFVPFKQNYDYSNSSIKTSENREVKNYSNTKLMSYPANYYLPVAFGKSNNEKIIENIGVENFPSQEIVENLRNNPDKYLYDAHIEHYAPLLDCKTLDEAKKIFSEFEDVIDSKDIDIKELDKRSTLYKVSQGKIEGANIETLSLDLLKKYYGEALNTANKENYYGLSLDGVFKLLKALRINSLDKNYAINLSRTNPNYREKAQQRGITQFDITTEEGRKARKEARQRGKAQYDETTEEGRKARDENRQRSFIQFDMNTIAGQKARDEAKMYALDYHNSNYGRIQNLSRKLSWYFNPKERYTMSQIASDNPQYAEAINKRGINIIYNNDLALLAYFKACEDAMPGHKRIKIGPVEINTANDIRNRMEAVKQGSATEDDMIILSSYYLLTKAQAPEYLDCFSEVEETLLENEDTFNEAVNRMSDFCSNMQKEYPEEIYDKCFSRLQSVLNE